MGKDFNYIEWIENYLDGDLSEQEVSEFHQLLETDKDFAQEFAFRKRINNALKEKEVIQLRQKMNAIHSRIHSKEPGTIIRRLYSSRFTQLAAASVAILFVLFSYFRFIYHPSMNPDELFNKYYQPEEAIMVTRSANFSDTLMFEALKLYENEDYEGALRLFENEAGDIAVHFYSGFAYIEINKFSEAINSFQKIIDHNDNIYVEQADWYIALCLMKSGDSDNAVARFSRIEMEKGTFAKNASDILKSLE